MHDTLLHHQYGAQVFSLHFKRRTKDPRPIVLMLLNSRSLIILEKSVERGVIVQAIGFTVLSKNLSFTRRLSGYFLEMLWNQEFVLETVSN